MIDEAVSTIAAAQLTPFANASLQVSGTAIFRTTTEGVDMTIELRNCMGRQQYAQQILEAASCTPDVVQAPVWSDGCRVHPVQRCFRTQASC
jgi:hypothetical protein